jgi:hypothetical protein
VPTILIFNNCIQDNRLRLAEIRARFGLHVGLLCTGKHHLHECQAKSARWHLVECPSLLASFPEIG